jgi:serine/threonine protein kinase
MKMAQIYPKANPMALDLLDHMLVFNPAKRWSILKCMRHPYFHSLYSPDDELYSETIFDWAFDTFELTKASVQEKVYNESLEYHPD